VLCDLRLRFPGLLIIVAWPRPRLDLFKGGCVLMRPGAKNYAIGVTVDDHISRAIVLSAPRTGGRLAQAVSAISLLLKGTPNTVFTDFVCGHDNMAPD
jgi:hypothetical protein